nr:hypothetical protein [Zhihengliuella flava]
MILLAGAGISGAVGVDDGLPVTVAVIASVAVATVGGGPVAEVIFRWASFRGGEAQASDEGDVTHHVLRGGLWIGLMERVAIASTLWAGWPEGLAVVLAVKGLGRFTELKQHAAAEQFILGTFASVLWACAAYGVGLLLI